MGNLLPTIHLPTYALQGASDTSGVNVKAQTGSNFVSHLRAPFGLCTTKTTMPRLTTHFGKY